MNEEDGSLITLNGLKFIDWVARDESSSELLTLIGIDGVDNSKAPELIDGAQALVASGLASFDGEGIELGSAAFGVGVVMSSLSSSIVIVGTKGDELNAVRVAGGGGFRVLLTAEPPGLVRVGLLDGAALLSDVVIAAVSDLMDEGGALVSVGVELPASETALIVQQDGAGISVVTVDKEDSRQTVGQWGSESVTDRLREILDQPASSGS